MVCTGRDRVAEGASLTSQPLKREVKEKVWGLLKHEGFSDFTDRLAHRVSSDVIEVVEILPLDRAEQRRLDLPDGLLHVGLGAFWPLLLEEGPVRWNRSQMPRPTVRECHVMMWLMPRLVSFPNARTAFCSALEAQENLADHGLPWLSLFQHLGTSMSFLKKGDWEIFCKYPLIRGLGSRSSSRRLLILAFLAHRLSLISEANEFLRQAEAALQEYPTHFRPRYQKWFDQVCAVIHRAS